MRILYIYRHPDMGFSIGKVFRPIEEEMRRYAEVDAVYMPVPNYSLKGLWKNIRTAQKAVKAKHYDIVHITGAEYYLIPFLKGQNVVVTVHDLGFFTNFWPSIKALWKYLMWIRVLNLAKVVTFISEKSKIEAERYVRFAEGQSIVVNNPVDSSFKQSPKEINVDMPIILHVGTKPNKNLESSAIALKGYPCKLRIVGGLTDNQRAILDLYNIDYENVCNLTDEEILQEYINCDYVNFPSFYEGFGMPIIEGQAIGRPVLTSNISPMKEIAGEGAVLVDPTDPEDIRRGYEELKSKANILVKKGCENVKYFSLERITKEYYKVYAKILGL